MEKKRSYDIILMDNSFMMFKFNCKEEKMMVKMVGPWFVVSTFFTLEDQRKNFRPSKAIINRVVVWIQLPYLPFAYGNCESIQESGVKADRPTVINAYVVTLLKGAFTSVCVEIDVSQQLGLKVSFSSLEEFVWQKFLYESICIFYFCYRILGHCSYVRSLLLNSSLKRKVAAIKGDRDVHNVIIIKGNTQDGITTVGENFPSPSQTFINTTVDIEQSDGKEEVELDLTIPGQQCQEGKKKKKTRALLTLLG